MTDQLSAVSLKQLPEKLDLKQGQQFFRELENSMNMIRPAIVLDCSRVRQMDESAIHLLLCCLEGALKRNGDVRLCCVHPKALLPLQIAGVDRLFKIFDTPQQAVESFQRRLVITSPTGERQRQTAASLATENAA